MRSAVGSRPSPTAAARSGRESGTHPARSRDTCAARRPLAFLLGLALPHGGERPRDCPERPRRKPTRPLQPADDPLGLLARERAQRLRVLGAEALELHQDLDGELVGRRLEDLDDVVAPERDVDADQAAARLLDHALALLDPLAPAREAG